MEKNKDTNLNVLEVNPKIKVKKNLEIQKRHKIKLKML